MAGLVDVFKYKEAGDGGIVDGFSFRIYSNVRRESVYDLKVVREVFNNMNGEEYL